MNDFFSWLYGVTSFLYSTNLDNWLYQKETYAVIGLWMVLVTAVASLIYYYVWAPVRRKGLWWGVTCAAAAIVNFIVAICYCNAPLSSYAVPQDERWTWIDNISMGFANILWGIVTYLVVALIWKWWSVNSYVPFKKF